MRKNQRPTDATTTALPSQQQKQPLPERGRVLVADALPAARAYVGGVLRVEGCSVVECGEALAIAAIVRQRGLDVVFLDVGIPALDPDACIRNLERGADTRSAVVVLTCPRDVDVARLAAAEASGALLVLVKPLTPEGVLHAFRQALAESRSRRAKPPARRRRAA